MNSTLRNAFPVPPLPYDSFVSDNDVKDLMERCSVLICSENENIDVDNDDFCSDKKINQSLIHLLKSTTKRSSVVMT